jgi:hypothetical protein
VFSVRRASCSTGVVPNLLRHWPIFAAALAATVHVQPARACGATPCAQVREIQPPEGSVDVPLNTEIRVLYFGMLSNEYFDPSCDVDLRPMRLQPDGGGDAIYLTGTVLPPPAAQQAWVIAKHVEPLAAETGYAVQLLLAPGQDACGCDGREWTTVSSFTSGVGEDHEPPTFTGIDSVEYGERAQSLSSCGNNDGIPVFLDYAPVTDVSAAPRYNIYVDDQIATRYAEQIGSDQYGELFVNCADASGITPGASVEVRGVDLAGNESPPNTPLTIDVTCEVVPVDLPMGGPVGSAGTTGSVPSPVDTPSPVTPTVSSKPSSGCDLSRSSAMARDAASGAGAAALAGVLLLLFGGRVAARRRASRSPR